MEKFKNAASFIKRILPLKEKVRTGWKQRETKGENLETISAHSWSAGLVAFAMYSEFEYDVDIYKVMTMLQIHDLPESVIADYTPFCNISLEEKANKEALGMIEVTRTLKKGLCLVELFNEFEDRQTKEAIFANVCDKLDALIQAKYYQDNDRFEELSKLKKHTSHHLVQEMIDKGAKTVFDVWREMDRKYYKEEEIFTKMLEFLDTFDFKI